jgi:hypothetical protein
LEDTPLSASVLVPLTDGSTTALRL